MRLFAMIMNRTKRFTQHISREFRALQIEHQERAFFATSKGLAYWLSNERIKVAARDLEK